MFSKTLWKQKPQVLVLIWTLIFLSVTLGKYKFYQSQGYWSTLYLQKIQSED